MAEFCQVGEPGARVIFDLDRLVASGSDTSAALDPIHTGPYNGFTTPIPFMMPEAGAADRLWEADGYHFSIVGSAANWSLVRATPTESAASSSSSIYLYSDVSGVLAYRLETRVYGELFVEEYYSCGDAHLDLRRLRK